MVEQDETANDIMSLLQRFDEKFQIGPQPVEALITLNPARLPGHILATAFSDNMRDGKNNLLRPIENLQVGMKFLASSQSDAQYNSRFGQVINDITVTNMLAEICGAPGEMITGDFANQSADEYVQQMIEDECNPTEDDMIARSLRLRLRGGAGSKSETWGAGGNATLFNGVGLFKKNLSIERRSNPF